MCRDTCDIYRSPVNGVQVQFFQWRKNGINGVMVQSLIQTTACYWCSITVPDQYRNMRKPACCDKPFTLFYCKLYCSDLFEYQFISGVNTCISSTVTFSATGKQCPGLRLFTTGGKTDSGGQCLTFTTSSLVQSDSIACFLTSTNPCSQQWPSKAIPL